MILVMEKVYQNFNFGKRLAELRKQKGLSQAQLAKLVSVSLRVIAYYEAESKNLPVRLVKPLATVLNCSTDELLGIKILKQEMSKEEIALWRRFKRIKSLSIRDKKTIFSFIHALVSKRQNKNRTN